MKINLMNKLLWLITSSTLVVGVIMGGIQFNNQIQLMTDFFQLRINQLVSSLDASVGQRELQDHDLLQNTVLKYVLLNPDIIEMSVGADQEDGLEEVVASSNINLIGSKRPIVESTSLKVGNIMLEKGLEMSFPWNVNSQHVGHYRIIISNQNERSRLQSQLIFSGLIVGGSVLITNLLFWIVIRGMVIIKLEKLTVGVIELAEGRLSHRINIHSGDEIGKLAKGFNTMALQLESSQNNLATEVKRKTAELEKQIAVSENNNLELEQTKLAMMNILEDERVLEDQLREEKAGVEAKVEERTKDLEMERAKLMGSIENLPVGFVMVDQDGSPVMSNAALSLVFDNINNDGVLNQIRTWLTERAELELDKKVGLPVLSREYKNIESGSKFINLSISPITVVGETKSIVRIGWVILVDDVTEERMTQKSRDEFFSIASHELRTPLTAIRGNTALIRDYYPEVMKDESLAPIITDIHTASLRLIQIVNDFLDASRLELNKIQFKLETFDVMTVAKKVVETEKAIAMEKKISCDLVVDGNEPIMVLADPARVEQIMYNLMGNALKFTKEGGVSMEIKLGEADKVLIRVIDTGAGIPVDHFDLLFKKFQQAGASVFTREASEGSGMGLYISSLLAAGMKAKIHLESSELGKGSVFVLELPKG